MAVTLGQAKAGGLLAKPAPFAAQAQFGQSQATGQLQQQIQQAAQGPGGGAVPNTAQIQQLSAQVATARAQPALQAQQAAAEDATKVAQLNFNNERLARVRVLQDMRQKVQVGAREQEQRLFTINANLKGQLFDAQMKFQKDELGRTVFNERQLADWAIAKAKNEEELAKYEQITAQTLKKKEMMMDQAWKVLEQSLETEFAQAEQRKDYTLQRELRKMKQKLEEDKARMTAKQAGTAALFQVGGAVLGGVIGGLTTGGAGAGAGATIGANLGSVAYSKYKR